jgi:hypothetical protein
MKFGCVSWIYPGTYYENAVLVAKLVDFIELLVYTWDKEISDLLSSELDDLLKLKVFYNVHLPTDNIQNCSMAYDFFRDHKFPIRNYVLHPLDGWQLFIKNKPDVTLENLIDSVDVYKNMTIDIGHLMLSKSGEEIFLSKGIKEIREFHVHGLNGGKDHELLDDNTINYIAKLAGKYKLVGEGFKNNDIMINFEIFDYDKFLKSIRRFKNAFF